jgi:hypothetical protein
VVAPGPVSTAWQAIARSAIDADAFFGDATAGRAVNSKAAFLWASLLMIISSVVAYFIMKRIGIIR